MAENKEVENKEAESGEVVAHDRTPRGNETREAQSREAVEWRPASLLPDPQPREGWAHRWIRVASGGKADPQNLSMRVREGWEPCPADEYPEMASLSDDSSEFGRKGQIEVGGLLLCRAPIEMVEARRAYYHKQATGQMAAVEAQMMKNSDSRMPIQKPERRSETTFGSR